MFRIALVAFAAVLIATPALADRIDGDWCDAQGAHLSINGPEITLPSRVTLQGDYRRHTFAYVAPAGESDAGKQIYMQQLDDEHMNYYRVKDGKAGEPELWRRCEITS
jgi:hypothetical protein